MSAVVIKIKALWSHTFGEAHRAFFIFKKERGKDNESRLHKNIPIRTF